MFLVSNQMFFTDFESLIAQKYSQVKLFIIYRGLKQAYIGKPISGIAQQQNFKSGKK